ncbi:tRNA lysidine(34) synthetase TilS [Selenomonas sputigena]|uniref:tRNA(Ile)-lysidine synthase n=1 Tax=Selenomonas sputigena TaxID=69823 RepID=A0ABV3X6V0_9FIRM
MLDRVLRFCTENGIGLSDAFLVVAVSGGADSMALLDILLRLRERLRLSLHAAHFEHGIRGEASREDARYVAAFCEARGVPCTVEAADVPAYARAAKLSLETAARDMRYRFLRRLKATLGASAIAAAHHADDQAETVLLHILRGAGLHGAAGMRPCAGDIVRPLLGLRKAELVAYCAARDIEVRHDATNDAADGRRNYLRLEIVPRLEAQVNSAVGNALVRFAETSRADDEALEEWTAGAFARMTRREGNRLSICRSGFREQPVAVQRRMVQRAGRFFTNPAHTWDYGQVETVRRMLIGEKSGLSRDLPGRIHLEIDWERAHFFPASSARSLSVKDERQGAPGAEDCPVLLAVPGRTLLPQFGLVIEAEFVEERRITDGITEVYADAASLGTPVVRTRKPGDRIGAAQDGKKLKDFFIAAHVPRRERDQVPLVCTEAGAVLWAVGLRRFAAARVESASGRIVRLRADPLPDDEKTTTSI